jgi:LEA14-like dessication related protein
MKPFWFALGGVLLVVMLGGCATLSRPGSVSVTLVDVRPLQASLLESTVAVTLRYTNEAMEPVSLEGSSHRLYLNESYVGRAVSDERVSVPRLGTVTQTVTVHLENLTLMRKAGELAKSPRIGYRLESRLHPAEGQGFGSMKAMATGELDISGLGLGSLAQVPGS